jgi:hypothetical protein
MLRRVLVGDNERVLLIRNKRFADILAPGEYWLFVLGRDIQLERHNIKSLAFSSDWADFIVTEHRHRDFPHSCGCGLRGW